jgi:putative ABC transport system permease protein
MFRNYLKVALRNILRHKGYSFINISGLAIGMACCILILLYVQHELSFDRYHKNSDRIYRLVLERKTPEGTSSDIATPPPLGPALVNDFPQCTHAVHFLTVDNPIPLVGRGDKRFYEKRFYFTDPSVSVVFTIPFVQGDPKIALQKPNAVIITEETARKYFGEKNPLGEKLTFNNSFDLEVTGVIQSPPSNSTLQFDFLASFSTLYGWLGRDFVDDWQNNMCQTYILLSENSSAEALARQLPGFIEKYLGKTGTLKRIRLQPLNRIHLFSYQDYGLPSSGDIYYVYLLSGIAVFILLIACINFINLTTARSALRSKEVSVRKVIGATKRQLVQQFLGEALLQTVVASLAAVLLAGLGIPYLNAFIGKDPAGYYAQNPWTWFAPIGIVLFAGLMSGSYPAFVLSSHEPVQSLKTGSKRVLFRKVLVVVQFTLTITLVIGTWIVYDQLNFMQNKQMGFDKDQVMVVPIRDQNLRQDPGPLKSRILQQPGVLQVGAAALLPGGPVGKTRFRAEGNPDIGTMSMLWVDQDFIKTLGIKIVAGRDFSKDFMTDASGAFILNEEAVRQLGWSVPMNALGKSFETVGGKKGTIIGVVKDFNFVSLHRKIEPLVLHMWPWLNYVLIRVDAARFPAVLDGIKDVWHEFDPGNPFTFTFLNDSFERFYRSEKNLGEVSGYFTLLAVLIACLGLFGLAAFAAEQRTKEIGVRKVLGATVPSIVGMMTGEFVLLVLVANLLAWPIAWYAMTRWLQNYAYRTPISWWIFGLAGLATAAVGLLAVSYQTIRAALTNPVNSLRYE